MRASKLLFSVLAVGVLVFAPLAANAATSNFFGPIINEECECPLSAPDWGCVLQTFQNIVNLGISLSVIFFVLIFAYAGILLMVSSMNPENRKRAKNMLLASVIGFAIAMSAWLLVDFIMKTVYNGDNSFGPWNSILDENSDRTCIQPQQPPTGPSTTGSTTSTTGDPGDPQDDGDRVTHAQGAAILTGAGIPISSSGNCSDKTKSNCTSLDSMFRDTVQQAVKVKQACGCTVVVTGGTETGHEGGAYSHAAGYKIDLGANSGLDDFLENLTRSGSRGSDPRYLDSCGNEYVRESSPPHWDITVNNGVCSL